jgi:oligopeptide transport system substrate-binding protein
MSKPIRLACLVLLWVYASLFIDGVPESAETSGEPALEMPGAKLGGIYRQVLGNRPSTLDPAFVTDIYSRTVVSQVFDGLVQFDANLNPLPAIAEFWEASRDGRTWTFALRHGVMFHHGREVTADDVIYSFTRLLDSPKLLPIAGFLRFIQGAKDFMQGKSTSVQGLKALDRYTVQMILEEPLAPALMILGLTHAAIVPREEVERRGVSFSRAPIGAGPFKFVRWDPDHAIVLEANDHYYEGRPFLDSLVFNMVVGDKLEERFAEFLKGNLEETIIPSAKTEEVRTDPQYRKYQRIRKPTHNLLYLGFNTQLKPFDDKRVRQAFNYAVDKEAIVRKITQMGSLTATGTLPPGMPGHDPDLKGYDYDPAKARQLLAEAGYPGGDGFPVVQLWSSHKAESTKAELAAYQRYLVDVGVTVEIHFAPDWPTFQGMLEHGKLPMFRLTWYADIPDPDNFLFPLLHSSSRTNRTFYRNPHVDRLLEQARKELDEAKRISLYREIERIAIADAPWISQHYSVLEYLYQPYVQGLEVSLLGKRSTQMKKIWIEKRLIGGSGWANVDVQPRK